MIRNSGTKWPFSTRISPPLLQKHNILIVISVANFSAKNVWENLFHALNRQVSQARQVLLFFVLVYVSLAEQNDGLFVASAPEVIALILLRSVADVETSHSAQHKNVTDELHKEMTNLQKKFLSEAVSWFYTLVGRVVILHGICVRFWLEKPL